MTGEPAEILVLRPYRLRFVAAIFGLALAGLYVGGWFALPRELRDQVTVSQLLTLLAFLVFFLGVLAVTAGSVVVADAEGLRIRNGLRHHEVPWSRVHKFLLRPGDPWASVLLRPVDGTFEVDLDAEKRQLMGVQAHDGERARRAVEALRARHQAWWAATRSRGT